MAKLTSKEIARLAGVSTSTVSIVLHGKSGVSDETRNRILRILNKNGHSVISRNAPKLKGGILQFCKIVKHGQIVNEKHNTFISEYTDGIIEEAKTHGMNVGITVFNQESMHKIAEFLRSGSGIAGSIILATELSEQDILDCGKVNMPIVFLDAMYDFLPCDFITMDNINMTFDMIRHFKDLGHKDIGLLYGEGCSNFSQRKLGFVRSMRKLGLAVNTDWMIRVGSKKESVKENMIKYLGEESKLPTAFFACNDMIAIGAMEAFQQKKIRIPEDISIAGFDDISAAFFVSPKLTTLSVPKFEIGRMSVKVLADNIKNRNTYVNQKLMLSGQLIERESSGFLSV